MNSPIQMLLGLLIAGVTVDQCVDRWTTAEPEVRATINSALLRQLESDALYADFSKGIKPADGETAGAFYMRLDAAGLVTHTAPAVKWDGSSWVPL